MRAPRFKGIARISTVEQRVSHRYEFTYADLCRLLRLPEGTKLTVEVLGGEGMERELQRAFDLLGGSVLLVATVTVQS